MLYFIAEDENSAHTFWIKVLDVFIGDYIEIKTNLRGAEVYGNKSLESKVDNALNQAKPGDKLFVAFDSIGSPFMPGANAFDSGDFILNTYVKCEKKNVSLFLTKYYCFEEIYITYKELEDMCRKDGDVRLADALRYVRMHVDNKTEYFNKKDKNVQYVISLVKDGGYNKEHFSDALLYQATKSIKHGIFTISKKRKEFGECWIEDCNEFRTKKKTTKTGKTLSYFCEHCNYCLKDRDTKQKLIDLHHKSILRYQEKTIDCL